LCSLQELTYFFLRFLVETTMELLLTCCCYVSLYKSPPILTSPFSLLIILYKGEIKLNLLELYKLGIR
jgi:hypothetical protein